MILRTIELAGWRSFAEEIAVGPLGDGLNVLYGANGSGKSTLLGGLVRGLFDSHRTRGREVEALRPWGRPLTPRVRLVFEHEGSRYRVDKRFLDQPSTLLAREEDGALVPWAEGDQAQQQLRALLAGEAPQKGLATVRHWGLRQVLWSPQGEVRLPPLSDDVVGHIRAALGAQLSTPHTQAIEDRLKQRYAQVFTPTGKLKRGKDAPPAVALVQQQRQLAERRDEARQQLAAFEAASDEVAALDQQCAALQHARGQMRAEHQLALAQAAAYEQLAQRREVEHQRATAAAVRFTALETTIRELAQLERDDREAAALEVRQGHELPALAAQRQEAAQRQAERDAVLEAIKQRRLEVAAAEAVADEARKYAAARRQRAELDERIGAIEQAAAQRDRFEQELAALAAPSGAVLQQVRQAARRRESARARLDASLIRVEITPLVPLPIEVVAGAFAAPAAPPTPDTSAMPTRPAADGARCVEGSPEVVVRLGDVALVRATGPSETAQAARADFDSATCELARWTADLGTDDVAELERRFQEAAALVARRDQAAETYRARLAGADLDALRTARDRHASQLAQWHRQQPTWADQPPDADALAHRAQPLRLEVDQAIDAAERAARAAGTEAAAAQMAHERCQSEIAALAERRRKLTEQLAARKADGRRDEERQGELDELALEARAARAAVEKLDVELARYEGDPGPEVARLSAALERLDVQLQELSAQSNRAKGRLESLASQAPYTVLAEIEEQLAEVEHRLQVETRRQQALALLFETVTDCRNDAVQQVSEPVEERASELLARLAGRTLGRIALGEQFAPAGLVPLGLDQPIELAELSGGEFEQLQLAVRLALAEAVLGERRELLVLDDALTATDGERLQRAIELFEEAAERYQILLLTCHPERYTHLERATLIDLAELAAAAGR